MSQHNSRLASGRWDDGAAPDTSTVNHYAWFDGAVLARTEVKRNDVVAATDYAYSGSGYLLSATVGGERPRTVTYWNDLSGQVLRRDEADNRTGGDPHEVWHRFNGREIGYTGNNGAAAADYQDSVRDRQAAIGGGAFRFGAGTGSSHADFEQGPEAMTSYATGGAGGGYRARAGDTLTAIAARLWGDASLWYKLAEASRSRKLLARAERLAR